MEGIEKLVNSAIFGSYLLFMLAVLGYAYSRVSGLDPYLQLALLSFIFMLFMIGLAKLASLVVGRAS